MKRSKCVCKFCTNVQIHNLTMKNENHEYLFEAPNTSKVELPSFNFFEFVLLFIRYVGMFVFGIIVGAGIVLKNPPIKIDGENLEILKKENNDLKNQLDTLKNEKAKQPQTDLGQPKHSITIKN